MHHEVRMVERKEYTMRREVRMVERKEYTMRREVRMVERKEYTMRREVRMGVPQPQLRGGCKTRAFTRLLSCECSEPLFSNVLSIVGQLIKRT